MQFVETERTQDALLIKGDNARHLITVRRLKCGHVLMTDRGRALVTKIDKKSLTIELSALDNNDVSSKSTPLPAITLYLSITKPSSFESALDFLTEGGVEKIIPVITARVQSEYIATIKGKSARLNKIIREARQQSGSAIKTALYDPIDIARLPSTTEEPWPHIVLWEEMNAKDEIALNTLIKDHPSKISILIGPEGGVKKDEILSLLSLGWEAIHFHAPILRAPVAALWAVAAIRTLWNSNPTT